MVINRYIIFKWITSQEWFNEFNKELIIQRNINFCTYLYTFYWNTYVPKYENLIRLAFTWADSSLGNAYWAKINCYFNGQIIKTFSNNIEASKYFNKAPNTISYKKRLNMCYKVKMSLINIHSQKTKL